jgi:hypothetical protein
VRLPDLNWPIDLFTDVTMPIPKTIAMVLPTAAATPTLWKDMLSSWIGTGASPGSRWRALVFDSAQIVS